MTPSFDPRAMTRRCTTDLPIAAGKALDHALPLLLVITAFLLGCQELASSDIWWHVRSGQWILEHRSAPGLDPFTFTSSDLLWVDMTWLFQVMLAVVFAAGGVRSIVLVTAAMYAAVMIIVSALRDRRWPSWLFAGCWLPALALMSIRFVPRPEVFSVLGMAAYLSILRRVDSNPRLAWILPLIQVIWVNAHGVFVLGPIILAAYLAERLVAPPEPEPGEKAGMKRPPEKRWWAHVGAAAALVVVACLVNPYGLRGALFPFDIFPKITAWGGLYKASISENGDLHEYLRRMGPSAIGGLYVRIECFLLWAVPLSFIGPAVWRTRGTRVQSPAASRRVFRGGAGVRRLLRTGAPVSGGSGMAHLAGTALRTGGGGARKSGRSVAAALVCAGQPPWRSSADWPRRRG